MPEKSQALGAIKHMNKSGILRVVIIGAVIGIALILIGGNLGLKSEKEENTEDAEKSGYSEFLEYKEEIERELEGLCSSISGVSEVKAVVFFDDRGGSKYAQNNQSGGYGEKSEYVIIGSGSSSHALYLGEELPKICGIGVVCRTGNSESKRAELAVLISATYGLSMTRVYVSEAE